MFSGKLGYRTSLSRFHHWAASLLRLFRRIHEAAESGRSSHSTNTFTCPVLRSVACNKMSAMFRTLLVSGDDASKGGAFAGTLFRSPLRRRLRWEEVVVA